MSRRFAKLRTLTLVVLACLASSCTQMGLIGTRPVRGNGQGYDVLACASGRAAVRIFSDPATRIGTANVTRDGVDKAIATTYTESGSVRSYQSDQGLALSVDLNAPIAPDDSHLAAQFSDSSFTDKLQCSYTPPVVNVTPEVPPSPMISIYRFFHPDVPGLAAHYYFDDRDAGLATGAQYEGARFKIWPEASTDSVALYRCDNTNPGSAGTIKGNFLSLDAHCEGTPTIATRVGYVGGTYSLQSFQLYRCKQATAPEYIHVLPSDLAECSTAGWTLDIALGYAMP